MSRAMKLIYHKDLNTLIINHEDEHIEIMYPSENEIDQMIIASCGIFKDIGHANDNIDFVKKSIELVLSEREKVKLIKGLSNE